MIQVQKIKAFQHSFVRMGRGLILGLIGIVASFAHAEDLTISYDADDNLSEYYTGEAEHGINVIVSSPTNAKVQYSETGADGTWVDALGYKDVCTDKVMYFKITSEGYTTVVDSRKVTINPKQINNEVAWLIFEDEDGYVYDGTAKEPDTECSDGNPSKITADDYEVTYENNVNAGTARAKFTGKGNYTGTFYEEFEISSRPVALTSGSASKTYDGTALTEKTMTVGGDGFVAGQGVTYTYTGTQLAVGESDNTFTYTFNDGTLESNYEITPAYGKLTITPATIDYIAEDNNPSEVYTGAADHTISVTVTKPTNAKVQYSETGADGTWVDALGYKDVCTNKLMYFKITSEGYTIVIDSRKVTINPKQISNEVAWLIFEDEDGYVYDSTAKEPDTECGDGNPSKITADDYEVTYENNVNAGTARAKFTGKGNYTGTFYEEFEILPRSITLTSGSASKTYDGTALTEKTMTVGGDGFIAGQGATYTYTGMQLAVGESDNTFTYTFNDGTLESNYEITPAYGKLTITPATIEYIAEDNNPSEVYTGAADHKISVTVTKPTNAKVQYSETGADGTWVDTLGYKDVCTDKLMYFKITSEGYTTVVDSRKVTIQPKQISNQIAWLVFESEDGYVYDGTAKEPGTECGDGNPSKITVDDYEVTYESNVNAGTARAKFTGKGNYMGMFYEEFEILPRSITLTSGSASKTYDGTALTEKTMTVGGDGFVAGQGATYTYTGTQLAVGESNNTFTYTFKDGTLESNYEITSAYGKLMINKATINNGDGEPGDGTIPTDGTSKFDVTAEYDGEGHTLDTAALSEAFTAAVVGGTIDCTYALSSDATATWQVTPPTFTNAGTYSVWYKISAANYDDFIHEAKVTITSRNISHATIAPLENANYTGSPIQPTPTVTDGMPSIITTDDYVISYANNTDVGTATLTLTGTRNYTGTTSATFEIISTSIQYATLSGTLAWKLNLGSGCYTAQLKLTCTEGLANGISKLRFIYQDRTSGTTLTSALYNSAARANRPTTTYAGTIYRYVDLDATRITAENAVVIYGVQDVTQPRGIVKKDECLIELYVRSLSTPVSDLGYVTWTSNGKECMLPITAAGGSQGIEVSAAMTTARQIVTSFSPTSSPLSLAALNQSLAMGTVLDAASNPYCKLVEFSVSSTAVQGRIEVGKENTNGEQTQGKLGTNAQVILMGAQSLDANFEELGRIKTAADGRFTFNLEKSGYHFFKVRLDIQDAIN